MTVQRPSRPAAGTEFAEFPGSLMSSAAAKALAVLRIGTGIVFLWAFFDKLFGWHYTTAGSKAWIHGGSPTKGFLKSVQVGPFQSTAHAIAGTWWADWLFMIGLLGIGAALVAGVAVRIAGMAGALMMLMMWFAEFPPAQHTSSGAPTVSTNPLVDYHVVYGLVLVLLALSYGGTTWGLGRRWSRIPFVRRHSWAG